MKRLLCYLLICARFQGMGAETKTVQPLSAADELKTFSVPPGFVVELAASEPDLPKPITVTWDDAGRMWSITAVEYPVDANETPAQAESLYRNPGRDKVLVYSSPKEGASPLWGKPQTFAEGLAIPLGVLPYGDGAFVHHGTEVVLLRDRDGDGRADQREPILAGFGVQDSHLMPHQFTYAPGGWIYLAQGAFNYSQVKTRDGVVIRYDQTKLARFRPDGSAFEILTHGPCNIWGLVITRFGETWIQEANDYGYPTMVFQPGANYPGCGDTKFKPYAPMQPSIASFRMGGTGLSGLALSEDGAGFPEPWRDVMFVANPITRQVQTVRIKQGSGRHELERLPDFLSSTDEMFRPIAIHFGPDACLYIVDWYNKIISHNEVPRNHPDRDKSHGRVWRVRHKDQKVGPIPNIAKATSTDLVKHLVSGNKWEWNAALRQIAARKATDLAPALARLIAEPPKAAFGAEAASIQIRVLWALESLAKVEPSLLSSLLRHENAHIRREAIRVSGTQLPREIAAKMAAQLAADGNHFVRTEVIRVLGGQDAPWKHHIISGAEKRPDVRLTPEVIERLLVMSDAVAGDTSKPGPAQEREFERYLIRAALEREPALLASYLDSNAEKLSIEQKLFAARALPGTLAAPLLAAYIPRLPRAPQDDELAILLQNPGAPGVKGCLDVLSTNSAAATLLLRSAMRLTERLESPKVAPMLERAAQRLLGETGGAALEDAFRAVGAFGITNLEKHVVQALTRPSLSAQLQLAGLKALTQMRSEDADFLYQVSTNGSYTEEARGVAILGLANSRNAAGATKLFTVWASLSEGQRRSALDALSTTKQGAEALLTALSNDTVRVTEAPFGVWERMRTLLPNNPKLEELWRNMGSSIRVLVFEGNKGDYVSSKVTLEGPFTVETWARLEPGISNHDGLLGSAARATNAMDINFHDGLLRVWVGSGENDIVIAKKRAVPGVWTHYAATRDEGGFFRLYVNGELDSVSKQSNRQSFPHLDIARTISGGGTAGGFTEYRIWKTARRAEEILSGFDHSLGASNLPSALVFYFSAEGSTNEPPIGGQLLTKAQLRGKARVEGTFEPPPLLSSTEAAAFETKFKQYRKLAEQPGKLEMGQTLFTVLCLGCHQAGGQGAAFAPNLDGSAHRATEALIRALLTPSAAMEAGYRVFRVETKDGELVDGFLAQQDATGVVLRKQNSQPIKIPSDRIKRAGFQNFSLMPEGLLEALEPSQVSDLFAYLRSLK